MDGEWMGVKVVLRIVHSNQNKEKKKNDQKVWETKLSSGHGLLRKQSHPNWKLVIYCVSKSTFTELKCIDWILLFQGKCF